MNSNLFPLIALVLGVVVIIVAVLAARRVRTQISGPFGIRMDLDSSNAGINATRMTSQEGGFRAHDRTGGGVTTDRVVAKKDFELSSSVPGESPSPKAQPPAKDRGPRQQ
jgi:hypothetical protein